MRPSPFPFPVPLSSVLLLAAFAAPAQTVVPALPTAKPALNYAGESFVIESIDARIVMAADGTGVVERTARVRVQSEAALRDFGVLSVGFASASQKVEILYARVRRSDGTVIDTPPADALEQPEPVTREAPFYSDLKDKQLPIKSLRVGDTVEWKVRIVRTRPEAPGNFWGQEGLVSDAVALEQTVELRFPKTVSVNIWTNPKAGVKPSESEEGNERVYRWQSPSLKPTAGPEAEAAAVAKKKKPLTPEEELDERQGALPSIAWTTFKSWAAVGEWYRSLESGRVVPDDQIKSKVAELTAGKTTQEEKVRAVYGFVAPQIRYIGVAFGVGRYQPHLASEVLDNQYGDCKDKHTLLAAMLTALGLHPDAVLIGDGIRFNEAVPSPAAFNHLITRVDVSGQPVWLDATAEVAPYRALAFDLRDKQALAVPETGEPRIERTPEDLPFPTSQTWKAVGALDKKGVSTSRITFAARGDQELLYRMVLRQVPPANYEELIQKISQSMGYGGTASHPVFSRPEDTSEPVTWSYDYKREQGGDWDHYRIIPQVAYNSLPLVDDKDPPIESIDLGWPRTETSSAEMKIPDGWGAELPEAVHAKSSYATLDETFRFDKGTIFCDLKVTVLKQRVPLADWKAYKKWTEQAGLTEQAFIQLTHTDGALSSNGVSLAAPYNAEAARLVQKANQALNQRDLGAASLLLDQAREISPTQQDLAGEYAALHYNRGEFADAIVQYQREVALHPNSVWVYAPLSRAQVYMKHRDDALASLRAWVAATPSDPAAAVALASFLLDGKDAPGAVDAAEKGLAALPEESRNDPALRLVLGKAQIAAGSDSKGAETLTALLHDTEDPHTLNNAAYALAKTTRELPLAEASVRKALDKLAEESRAWTLDEAPATLRQKSSLILSAWDTLGWILFLEGGPDKLAQAESFVRASWNNTGHTEVGEHLGDIESQRGLHQEAMRAYALALASVPGSGGKTDSPDAKRLKQKMEAEKKAGAKSESDQGLKSLLHLRTVSLSTARDREADAEYIVLLADGRVEKAHPSGEKSLAGGTEMILAAPVTAFAPPESDAKLARMAMLMCHSDGCKLVFEP